MSVVNSITQWTALADKLMHFGYEVAGAAAPEIQRNDDHRSAIGLMAVSLIARSLSNMRGTLAMTRDKRIVEAGGLARWLLENQFWAAGFAEDPDKFRQAMISQDLKKKDRAGRCSSRQENYPMKL